MRIVLLGPPGAGKGTQAARISDRYAVPVLATGDVLKAQIEAATPLGQEAAAYVSMGELVPDGVVTAMVRDRLIQSDCAGGFILDGYPRTLPQAESLTEMLTECGQQLDAVVELQVDAAEVLARIRLRAVAQDRRDDDEQTARHRLRVFAAETAPLREFYSERGLLVSVPGTGPAEQVTQRIITALERRRRVIA
ncbi:MAG: adenylate kinase [Actinobacteria bacterium]|nr:adenylate kinase [Actinomycetota bacterium]MBO0786441.1 adenylate kinase [Actinomycetota bacterium]MBO0818364.1 adenylate kinase [Actinomycetota bacterium]